MAQTVFNRIEKKYLLTEPVYHLLLEKIAPHMREDEYGRSTISNIYFDTEDDLLLRRSIQKPKYKEKLRLRSYGTPTMDTAVFLEIKKKYDGVVNKRRVELSLEEAYGYLSGSFRPEREDQILRELDSFLARYPLLPKYCLSYDRVALRDREQSDFRLTFDQNIRYRTALVRLENGDFGVRLLPRGWVLMESKLAGAAPLWFSNILSELAVRQVSFSKIGFTYKVCHESPELDRMLRSAASEQLQRRKERAAC